jgi:PKD repeat protein
MFALTLVLCSCNKNPVARFEFSPPGGFPPLQISFDASSSSDPDGTIVEYLWNFGDGTTAQGRQTTYEYTSAGYYTVTLQVTDNNGSTNSAQQIVRVSGFVQVQPVIIPGVLGGDPARTAVYRVDAAMLGISSLASLAVADLGVDAGTDGSFSGFDLDAVVLATQACADATCVQHLQPTVALDFSRERALLLPGLRRGGSRRPLKGTLAVGDRVDEEFATLGAFDANSSASLDAWGFVSLGDKGRLIVNLPTAVPTDNLYIYIGEVGSNELNNVMFFASEWSFPIPREDTPPAAVSQQSLIISESPPFYLAYSTDSVAPGTQVTLSARVVNGVPIVNLLPSPLAYSRGKPVFLAYESSRVETNRGSFVRMESGEEAFVIPTSRSPGVVAFAPIMHQSDITWIGTKSASKRIDVGNERIDVWEVDITFCTLGGCSYTELDQSFQIYLDAEVGDYPNKNVLGGTYASCEYQPSQVSVAQDPVTGLGMINVAPHIPTLKQSIYVPSEATFNALSGCSESEKDSLASKVLDHEAIHALMNVEWQEGKYGSSTVPGQSVSIRGFQPGTASPAQLERAKRFGYFTWCDSNVQPIRRAYNDAFDRSQYGKLDFSGISCSCVIGQANQDPAQPDVNCKPASASGGSGTPTPVQEAYHCPCNGINYGTLNQCLADCHINLGCFTGFCAPVSTPR